MTSVVVKSYAEHWQQEIAPRLHGFRKLAAAETHAGVVGEARVGGHLDNALRLTYAGEQELARRFFELTEGAAKVALDGERLKQNVAWPRNRAEIADNLAIARGFLCGDTDGSLFLQASADFDEATGRLSRFTNFEREDALWSVRCALLGDDVARASDLVKRGWQRIRRHEEAELLKRLAARDHAVLPKLDDYFERARVPGPRVVTSGSITHPLEIAVLRAKLLEPKKPPDWWGAAALVGA